MDLPQRRSVCVGVCALMCVGLFHFCDETLVGRGLNGDFPPGASFSPWCPLLRFWFVLALGVAERNLQTL